MNSLNGTNDDDTLLEEYAAKKRVEFIPAMIFVAVFIIAGVIGNVFSFIYYGFKVKRIPSTIFISFLSAIDFVTCILMSAQIINLYYYVTFKSTVGCRMYRFFSYWFVYCSIFLLVVISIDRYRKLCTPFKRQFTLLSSKVAILISAVASVLIAVKTDIIIDVQHVNITNTDNKKFRGYQCFHTTKESMSKMVTAFYLIDFVIPIVLIVFFVVVYGLIIRNLVRIKSQTITVPVTNGDNYDSSCELSTTIETEKETNDTPTNLDSERQTESNTTHVHETHAKDMSPEIKLTIMTIVITVIFILSYIPYFVVILYVSFVLKIPQYELNVGIQIAYRFFVINSAANPYIFFIFNSAFRRFVKMFCTHHICCFKNIKDEV